MSMRMGASRYVMPAPATAKKGGVAEVAHVQAPFKGLDLSHKLEAGDPLTATVLTNLTIEDDRVQVRAGFTKLSTHASGQPVWHLVPYYGLPVNLLAAVNKTLSKIDNASIVKSGFTSDDWHWTSFANLGQIKYTVMVNGADGVWSWNGGFALTGTSASITGISKANPAVVTVGAADIAKFFNGMEVSIAGGTATGGWNVCNGTWVISNVGSPANTFTLPLVNTSACTGTPPAMTATPAGSIVKEPVTGPPTEAWINVDTFNIVVSHQNRLFFADNANLVIYYLPIQQKAGQVKFLPMNNMFRRGGVIRAMYTWSVDSGVGMDDLLVVFSSNGECVIWKGIDPDTDFTMVGIFRFDSPMSKHSITNYGGDLYCLISTGMVAMTTVIRAETENLGEADRAVVSYFRRQAIANRSSMGWMLFLNPSTSRMFANIPQGNPNGYHQMVKDMPRKVWSKFEDIPARCWGWIDPFVYFGDDKGGVYQMHTQYQSDNGAAIKVDVQPAWSLYKSPFKKHFKLIYAYIASDGVPRPMIDIRVDKDLSKAVNQPEVTEQTDPSDALWDVAAWDEDVADAGWYWTPPPSYQYYTNWNGVAKRGRLAAPRLTAAIKDCTFSIAGFDVTYERGNLM